MVSNRTEGAAAQVCVWEDWVLVTDRTGPAPAINKNTPAKTQGD